MQAGRQTDGNGSLSHVSRYSPGWAPALLPLSLHHGNQHLQLEQPRHFWAAEGAGRGQSFGAVLDCGLMSWLPPQEGMQGSTCIRAKHHERHCSTGRRSARLTSAHSMHCLSLQSEHRCPLHGCRSASLCCCRSRAAASGKRGGCCRCAGSCCCASCCGTGCCRSNPGGLCRCRCCGGRFRSGRRCLSPRGESKRVAAGSR